jgi:hypothetical protein
MKNPSDLHEARVLAEGLLAGTDLSIFAANSLEVLLSELFEDDDEIDELIVKLAMYRPGGGDFLYSHGDLLPDFEALLRRLDTELSISEAQSDFLGDE